MKQIFYVKLTIATIYALFVLFFFTADLTPYVMAETRVQMQQRIIQEYIDKYDLETNCDAECVAVREGENPWLVPLAEQLGMDHSTLTRASIGHSIDWGFSFEALYGRPPTIHDWVYGWASIAEDFRYKLNATPPIFEVEEPGYFRYHREYDR